MIIVGFEEKFLLPCVLQKVEVQEWLSSSCEGEIVGCLGGGCQTSLTQLLPINLIQFECFKSCYQELQKNHYLVMIVLGLTLRVNLKEQKGNWDGYCWILLGNCKGLGHLWIEKTERN